MLWSRQYSRISGPILFFCLMLITCTGGEVWAAWAKSKAAAPIVIVAQGKASSSLTTNLDVALGYNNSNQRDFQLYPGTWTIDYDLTVPSNVTLKAERGAVLSVASGQTLTINGGFEAGMSQVFSLSGTGRVVFGENAVKEVIPQWWGAKGDNSHDDTAALQSAFDAYAHVYLPPGIYRTTAAVNVTREGQSIRGSGIKSILYSEAPIDVLAVGPTSSSTICWVHFADFSIWAHNASATGLHLNRVIDGRFFQLLIGAGGHCVYGIGVENCVFDGCTIGNMRPHSSLSYIGGTYGFYLIGSSSPKPLEPNANRIANCQITDINGTGVYIKGSAIGNTITRCTIQGNDNYGVHLDGSMAPTYGNIIRDCYMEGHGIADVFLGASGIGNIVDGCFLNSSNSILLTGYGNNANIGIFNTVGKGFRLDTLRSTYSNVYYNMGKTGEFVDMHPTTNTYINVNRAYSP